MRSEDVGLAALAAVTAGLVWFTVGHVSGQTLTQPAGAPGVSVRDDAAATSGDAAAATSTAPSAASLKPARVALAGRGQDAVDVLVLGDSTGDEDWEWVRLWAEDLSKKRPTSYLAWDGQDAYRQAEDLSTAGAGVPLVVYSGSKSGSVATYPLDHYDAMVPDAPSLVLLSYGHNTDVAAGPTEMQDLVDRLRDELGDGVPIVVVLQQPQVEDANADTREAIAAWARDEGLATIDVAAAFLATDDLDALLEDDLHPNEEGQRLWADVVGRALAPMR